MGYLVTELVRTFQQTALANTNAPIFAGISSAVANANGSLTVTWTTATTNGAATPIRYEIYILAGTQTATALFVTASRASIARSSQTSYDLWEDAAGTILIAGQIYTLGVRAVSAVNITDTNTVVTTATSNGVPSTSVYNLLVAVKAQTDQFTFTGSNVNAKTIINADKTGYSLTAGEEAAIAVSVWAASQSTNNTGGSFGAALQGIISAARANNLDNLDATVSSRATNSGAATAVWSSVRSLNNTTGTFGESNQGVVSTGRAANLDNLDATVSSRATQTSVNAVQSAVSSIQNNTSFVGIVPSPLFVPESGSTTYDIFAFLYEEDGTPGDPDSNTIDVRIVDGSGNILVNTTAMTRIGVGQYQYNLTISSALTLVQYNVFFSYTDDSVAFTQIRTMQAVVSSSEEIDLLNTLTSRLTQTRADNLDNLDATISSRATNTGVWATIRASNDVSGSFGEALQGVISTTRANNLDNLDVMVSTRADQTTANAIKSQTDLIPPSPATEGSVLAIPTNPLLTTDSRLNNLDAAISSRAAPSDLVPLAKTTDVTSSTSSIESAITAATTPLATAAALEVVQTTLDGLVEEGTTPEAMWTYSNRSLTAPVDVTTASQNAITGVLNQWAPKLTMAINPSTDTLTIMAWLDLNGQFQTATTSGAVNIYDENDVLVLAVGPDMMVSTHGIFSFSQTGASALLLANTTYNCDVIIVANSNTYKGFTPITVF